MPPASKVIKLSIYSLLFLAIVLTILGKTFFSNDIATSRFDNLKDLVQDIIRGKVINNSPYPVTIYSYPFKSVIPPGKTSKLVGVYDADGIVIDRPMRFGDHIYQSGILKFCDAATITLVSDDTGLVELQVSPKGMVCEWLGDLNHYPNAKAAFEPDR